MAQSDSNAIELELKDEKKTLDRVVSNAASDLKAGEVVDLDQAEIFLQKHNITHHDLNALLEDSEGMKRLVKRVDWMLMPLLCGTFLLQYIDKQSLSYAAVFDLFPTTHTTQDQYSWLISLFYFGYLVAEWPASYIAQKLPTGKVVSITVIVWGSILMLMAACQNFAGLAACRFLLGCFESMITPVFMMIVGQWYQRKEQPARAGLFYCFNGVGASTGGILFFAVGQAKGFDVWRSIFILAGGMTVCWGVLLLFFLPDNIMDAKRFSNQEKAMLIARSQQNQTGVFSKKIKIVQVKEALVDPQIWLLFFFVLLNETVNGGLANFSKLIIKGLANGDALLTTAYGIPTGCFQVAFVFSGPWLAGRFKNIRTYIMPLYVCPTIIATALLWQLPHTAEHNKGLLICNYIAGSYVASLVIALQLPANNVGGYTKRVTATAFVFLAYCAGNIIGPHCFLASEAPTYSTGCTVTMCCAAGQVVLSFCIRALLIRRNKKRDELYGPAPAGQALTEGMIEDKTDFENPNFRYSY
ncbi:Putative major facilitator superfamily, MFS transporter superfamily [Septoria linicola]|uniref:Major facilitator superfamily, MFS transporter superfamily n=1 Tax=Septoria linicola TaxID=215465 RepID=A0A9Q9AXX8_9PEZI|nr:putative major facilitator superfamily, MFS transporter superfamily [Septoria linicola]USW57114.1 Putative major facilitator superfamily, MFS transporter superfamily [Septoria linicola]